MNTPDTRWLQRLENYTNALSELTDAVHTRSNRTLSRLEAMGLIQAFEFTYELGWNLLKDYLIYQGVSGLVESRDTVRAAVTQGVLTEQDGSTWMAMLTDRNRTSHMYDEASIRAIESTIAETYLDALTLLKTALAKRAEQIDQAEQHE